MLGVPGFFIAMTERIITWLVILMIGGGLALGHEWGKRNQKAKSDPTIIELRQQLDEANETIEQRDAEIYSLKVKLDWKP